MIARIWTTCARLRQEARTVGTRPDIDELLEQAVAESWVESLCAHRVETCVMSRDMGYS